MIFHLNVERKYLYNIFICPRSSDETIFVKEKKQSLNITLIHLLF